MSPDMMPVSPVIRTTLLEMSACTGKSTAELLDAAVEEYRVRHFASGPVSEVPGVNPADVWEAAAEADAGLLTPHSEVFAKLRARP